MNKNARFKFFWVLFAILGILLIGALITPFRITLDNIFTRIEMNAIDNGTPELSCTSPNASGIMKATCFTLGGFLTMFILYLLYHWVSGMINGAKARGPVFAPKYKKMQEALEQ
jgi:hypothetical protein